MMTKMANSFPWPDARSWIGFGSFGLAIMILWMMKQDPVLREDEFFQTIATILIANGWMQVVSWGYSATKQGGELADRNATIVEQAHVANGKPQKVEIVTPNEGGPDEDQR